MLVVFRCAALPHALRGKRRYVRPLLVISGPKEASNLQPFLEDTVMFFLSSTGHTGIL